jgi:hypothetical protein
VRTAGACSVLPIAGTDPGAAGAVPAAGTGTSVPAAGAVTPTCGDAPCTWRRLANSYPMTVPATAVLILAHWLYSRVLPFVFKPSKVELWFFGVVTLLYYAFITVPAAPKALWVLPPLMLFPWKGLIRS